MCINHYSADRSRGFTLIELMITVAIVAILASIALPSYSNYVEKSKLRTAQSDVAALGMALENIRQRTLSYTAVNAVNTAAVTGAVQTWTPASNPGDYTFSMVVTSGTYDITATGIAGLANCDVMLDEAGVRTTEAGCDHVAGGGWL